MDKIQKNELIVDFTILIDAWIETKSNSASKLAQLLANHAFNFLNGEIRESGKEFCDHDYYTTEVNGFVVVKCRKCDYEY